MTAASNEVALLPCPNPWCPHSDPVVERTLRYMGDNSPCRVECECSMRGPVKPTEAEAIAAWNTRAHSDPRPVAEGLREAVVRIERFVSLMMPQVPMTTRRNCEADIVRMANDFADLRAALATHSPAPMAGEGLTLEQTYRMADAYVGEGDRDEAKSHAWQHYRQGLADASAALAAHPSTQEGADRG